MKVINYHNEKAPADKQVWIMRPGPFANPYRIGRDGNRLQVIEKFESYARRTGWLKGLIARLPADSVLVCCCKPKPCHGDVIVKLSQELNSGVSN